MAGAKSNVVPDRAEMYIDVRTLPGDTQDDVDEMLRDLIGPELMGSVEIHKPYPGMADDTPFSSTDTPLWDAIADSVRLAYPGARVVPSLVTGGTDARYFRRRGVEAYGAGLLSNKVSLPEFLNRFHGHNERIDIESLELTTQLWLNVFDRLWR